MRRHLRHRISAIVCLAACCTLASVTVSPTFAHDFYWGGGHRYYSYRVPYRNNYHGYWRDLGYGFTPNRHIYHSYHYEGYSSPSVGHDRGYQTPFRYYRAYPRYSR